MKNVIYSEGDIIVTKASKVATGESKKLQYRNKGPFVITKVLPLDTYAIQSFTAKGKAKRATTAHVSQIKIWRGFESESDDESDDNSGITDHDESIVGEAAKNVTYEREAQGFEEIIVPENSSDCKLRRNTRLRNQPKRFTNM